MFLAEVGLIFNNNEEFIIVYNRMVAFERFYVIYSSYLLKD